MSGAIGLDYNVLPMMFELYRVHDRAAMLRDLQDMEGEALKTMRETDGN